MARTKAGDARRCQTLRHEDEQGVWAWCSGAIHPRLRGRVDSCGGFEIRTAAEQTWREVPVPRVPLIITMDGAVELATDSGPKRVTSFVCGPVDGPTMTALGTRYSGLLVDLTPPAAAAILGLPLAEITRDVVALDDLMGSEAAHVEERLGESRSWPERIAIIQDFLVDRLAGARTVPAQLREAWRLMVTGAGRPGIRDLAARVGWSRQHLSARFREELGLPPKRLARVIRFDHAVTLARRDDPEDWSRIALQCGYYDQAHLVNEFRDLAGCTPSEYVAGLTTTERALTAREATFLQDSEATVD